MTRQQRLEELFDRALAQPRGARLAWLESACPDDPDLREEVAGLLAHADTLAGGFPGDVPGDGSPAGRPLAAPLVRLGPEGRQLNDPDAIGPYRILRRLGEGTYGVVFEVEQTAPLQRRLALKLLKAGMDTEEVLARFAAERRTLAMLDHPNIARVIDAGATPEGRPYVVMELVQGEPVTAYCDRLNLPLAARLDLFLGICRAVKYAHQRGVLHRDLKPSNILVALVDGRPLVKIIDFGIAKVTAAGAGVEPLATLGDRVLGTPAYMSPEQAAASRLGLDTASDVYSLGVVLYELLCGQLPHGPEVFRDLPADRWEQALRERPVVPPSERLRPADEAVLAVASRRGSDPWRLREQLRGDLDWITLRAMEPDRLRRYQTAQDLMQELERHFADQPVAAGPPTAAYRARKFVRRNRRGLALASAVALAALTAAGALTYALHTTERERREAVGARAEAESVLEFLTGMLGAARPVAEGHDVTVVEVLDAASASVEAEFGDRPAVAARMHLVIGQVQHELGRFEPASRHLARALDLHRELGLPTGPVLQQLGYLQRELGQFAAAESTFTQLLREFRRQQPPPQAAIVEALVDLGSVHLLHERNDEALAVLDEARTMVEAGAPVGDDLRSAILSYLGSVLGDRGEFARAEVLLREALDLDRARLGPDHPNVLAHMQTLGSVYREWGRPQDAVPLYRRSWELATAVYGADHPTTLGCRSNLALGLSDAGLYDEALAHGEAVAAERTRLLGPDHPSTLVTQLNLTSLHLRRGDPAAAAALAREVRERVLLTLGPDHRYALILEGHLGRALLAGGDPVAAERHLRASAEGYREHGQPGGWRLGSALVRLGECEAALARFADAEATLLEAHRILAAAPGPADERTGEAAQALADLYERWDRADDAARWRDAVAATSR